MQGFIQRNVCNQSVHYVSTKVMFYLLIMFYDNLNHTIP